MLTFTRVLYIFLRLVDWHVMDSSFSFWRYVLYFAVAFFLYFREHLLVFVFDTIMISSFLGEHCTSIVGAESALTFNTS